MAKQVVDVKVVEAAIKTLQSSIDVAVVESRRAEGQVAMGRAMKWPDEEMSKLKGDAVRARSKLRGYRNELAALRLAISGS